MGRVRNSQFSGRQAVSGHFLSYTSTNGFCVRMSFNKLMGGSEVGIKEGDNKAARNRAIQFKELKKNSMKKSNVSFSYYYLLNISSFSSPRFSVSFATLFLF